MIRAGERANSEFNFDARLLPQWAGCDSNARNNSLAYNLRLRSYQSDHDLQVQIVPEMTLRRLPYDPHHTGGQHIQIHGSFRVRDFPRGPAEPLTNVRCKWTVLRKYASGRYLPTTEGCCVFTRGNSDATFPACHR